MTGFYAATLLGSSVYLLLWLFLAYAFLGVLIEGAFFLLCERTLESRTGLLYLPLRPLYGVGGCGFALLLRPVLAQPVAVFVLGAVVATVVEYLASLLTERVFDAVSWDYRHKAINLHGRVCLSYSLCWGGLALVAVYLLDHPLAVVLGRVPRRTGETVLTVLMLLVLASSVLTVAALTRTRRRVAALRSCARGVVVLGTSTGWGQVVDRLVPDAVLVNTFPRMTLVVELCRLTGQEPVWVRLPTPRTWRRVTSSIARATTWLAATTPTRAGSDRS
jgi:uncharacterized membrane protein